MGNSCEHSRTEFVRTLDKQNGILFSKEVAEFKCLDCMTDGEPTIIRKDVTKGRVTGCSYSSSKINKNDCRHKRFNVDESTEERKSEATFSGSLLGAITVGWIEPRNHYIVAVATCKRCTAKFHVRCSYYAHNKWEEYEHKTVESRGHWKIVTVKIPHESTRYKEEISYVK